MEEEEGIEATEEISSSSSDSSDSNVVVDMGVPSKKPSANTGTGSGGTKAPSAVVTGGGSSGIAGTKAPKAAGPAGPDPAAVEQGSDNGNLSAHSHLVTELYTYQPIDITCCHSRVDLLLFPRSLSSSPSSHSFIIIVIVLLLPLLLQALTPLLALALVRMRHRLHPYNSITPPYRCCTTHISCTILFKWWGRKEGKEGGWNTVASATTTTTAIGCSSSSSSSSSSSAFTIVCNSILLLACLLAFSTIQSTIHSPTTTTTRKPTTYTPSICLSVLLSPRSSSLLLSLQRARS